jgi:4-amino-4-deoxy-L-arabinose transferase-like glycosyltransferase
LAHGRGFAINLTNPEFRRIYDTAAQASPLYRLAESNRGAVAYRPPLFPLVLAGLDRLLGRQLWSARVFNSACMAATVCLLTVMLLRIGGWGPALCGIFLFVVIDTRSRLYSRAILTEALSTFWIALLACLLCELLRRPKFRVTVPAAIVFGLAILTRSQFVLWLPGLLVLVGVLVFRGQQSHSRLNTFGNVAAFLLCAVLVLLPWMVRNRRLAGPAFPLGTQGAQELSAGYSDFTWNARGEWVNLAQRNFFSTIPAHLTSLQREIVQARLSKEQALHWMREHPVKTFALIPMKIYWEFKPRTASEAVVLVLSALGAIISWRRPQTRIGLALVGINALAIGLTWSVAGRFLVPLLFVFHFWTGLATWSLICWASCHACCEDKEQITLL